MIEPLLVGVMLIAGLGLAIIALYRGVKIRELRRQLREAQA